MEESVGDEGIAGIFGIAGKLVPAAGIVTIGDVGTIVVELIGKGIGNGAKTID